MEQNDRFFYLANEWQYNETQYCKGIDKVIEASGFDTEYIVLVAEDGMDDLNEWLESGDGLSSWG